MLDASSVIGQAKRAGGNIWRHLPVGIQELPFASSVSRWIHSASRKLSPRHQSDLSRCPPTTRFLRYPPLLQTIRELLTEFQPGDTVRLCVMACSTGAELYSILWAIRKARRDLNVLPIGIDLSESAIEKAKAGRYSPTDLELSGLPKELWPELFEITPTELKIKDWIGDGSKWILEDLRNSGLQAQLGLQDIVVANNFLIFMKEGEATACLRKVVQFIRPGGLLLCRGVDLDVRERVAQQFLLQPISSRIEELHNINSRERRGWPWEYWGLEPLDKRRKDWVRRYATIFRVPYASNRGLIGGKDSLSGEIAVPVTGAQ
jgi:hypothetical protein